MASVRIHLAGWTAVIAEEPPKVTSVKPMLRRRLSRLGKFALSAVEPLAADSNVPCVFSTRHGDIVRTMGLLRDMGRGEAVSPMHFSLSVHNAIGGIYSIATGNQNNITALATGPNNFSVALLEAQAILESSLEDQVLCIVYDEPLPEPVESFRCEPEFAYGAAFLLSSKPVEGGCSLRLDLEVNPDSRFCPPSTQALTFVNFLNNSSVQSLTLSNERSLYRWKR